MILHVVVACEGEELHFPFPADAPATIGSAPDNDWVLPFPGVSRRHAVAHRQGQGLRLEDVGSKNGLVVGGLRREQAVLTLGDAVSLGRAELRVEDAQLSGPVVPIEASAPAVVGTPGSSTSTEAMLARATETGAAAALELVRELAGRPVPPGPPTHRYLVRLRQALGAVSVVSVRRPAGDELALADLVGSPPTAAELEELDRRIAGRATCEESPSRWLLGPALPPGSAWLAAVLPRSAMATEEWRELALAFAAEHLLGSWPVEVAAPAAELSERSPGDSLRYPARMIVGDSPVLQRVLDDLRATVQGLGNVLLVGETGTGKELFARLVHASGPTPSGPWVACNVAAIPAELLEAELFGVAPRAATGVAERPGLFEQADGGVLFLDEIGDLPSPLQAKLLRVLQEREVRRVGAERPKAISVRIVSATNRDLLEQVRARRFREDLYYRLAAFVYRVPPLRERPEDVPPLVLGLVARFAAAHRKRIAGVSLGTLEALSRLPWPGNVRQLENELGAAVLRCPSGGVLKRAHFRPELFAEGSGPRRELEAGEVVTGAPRPWTPDHLGRIAESYAERKRALERSEIEDALSRSAGRLGAAAKLLGLTRQGLSKRMKRLGLR